MADDQWFYKDTDGLVKGPVSRTDLLELVSTKKVPSTSLVSSQNMKKWVPYASIDRLIMNQKNNSTEKINNDLTRALTDINLAVNNLPSYIKTASLACDNSKSKKSQKITKTLTTKEQIKELYAECNMSINEPEEESIFLKSIKGFAVLFFYGVLVPALFLMAVYIVTSLIKLFFPGETMYVLVSIFIVISIIFYFVKN